MGWELDLSIMAASASLHSFRAATFERETDGQMGVRD